MAEWRNTIFLSSLFILCCILFVQAEEKIATDHAGANCVYYGDRFARSQSSLSNCSWYSDMACCRRTEVTAVFGGMYALYAATLACEYRLNYMMCYFCSPAQIEWYDRHLLICADFCEETFRHCKDAEYNGEAIGKKYKNGKEFCEAQQFQVIHGRQGCFNFDASVFGSARTNLISFIGFVFSTALAVYSILL